MIQIYFSLVWFMELLV